MKYFKKHHLLFTVILIGTLVLDQLTKIGVTNASNLPLPIMGNFFQIIRSENTGIAFSIPIPQIILIPLIILIIIFGLNALRKEIQFEHPIALTSIALILAGSLGNLLDRLRLGHVVDFLAVGKFPIFNVADIGITCGIAALIFYYSKVKKNRQT